MSDFPKASWMSTSADKPFRFREFSLNQENCAMKAGTDNVLFGAWINLNGTETLLDVGAGSGLLSLMAAQRNPGLLITGVELSAEACKDAHENFRQSPWDHHLNLVQSDITEIQEQHFGQIICNPPFFNENVRSPDPSRDLARRVSRLGPEILFELAAIKFSVFRTSLLIPAGNEKEWILQASLFGFYPERICYVRPAEGKDPNRLMIEFSGSRASTQKEELAIRGEDGEFTLPYLELVRPFYSWA